MHTGARFSDFSFVLPERVGIRAAHVSAAEGAIGASRSHACRTIVVFSTILRKARSLLRLSHAAKGEHFVGERLQYGVATSYVHIASCPKRFSISTIVNIVAGIIGERT